MEMKKLVVNGVAYTVADPDAACIDNTKAGADAWSGKHIADRLCPGFSLGGSAVTCEPVEGYPLSVVSHIEPVQEGSGDPAPGGWSEVSMYLVDESSGNPTHLVLGDFEDGKKYRITFNAQTGSGERAKIASAEIYQANGPWGSPIPCTVGDYSVEFTMRIDQVGDPMESDSIDITLTYTEDVDADSMFDYDEMAGVYSLVDGALTFQQYDPGNLRPITGHSAVTLTRNGEEFTVALGQTVYGGSLNWATGVLTLDWKLKTFTGKEAAWNRYITATADTTGFSITISDKKVGFKTSICNMFKNTNNLNAYAKEYMEHGLYTDHRDLQNCYFDWGPYYPSSQSTAALAGFKAWLQEMYAAGTPVELCYQLAEPVTVQLKAQEILALSGTNTLHSSTGDTQVSGKADPSVIIEKLTNAIIALGGNI